MNRQIDLTDMRCEMRRKNIHVMSSKVSCYVLFSSHCLHKEFGKNTQSSIHNPMLNTRRPNSSTSEFHSDAHNTHAHFFIWLRNECQGDFLTTSLTHPLTHSPPHSFTPSLTTSLIHHLTHSPQTHLLSSVSILSNGFISS